MEPFPKKLQKLKTKRAHALATHTSTLIALLTTWNQKTFLNTNHNEYIAKYGKQDIEYSFITPYT